MVVEVPAELMLAVTKFYKRKGFHKCLGESTVYIICHMILDRALKIYCCKFAGCNFIIGTVMRQGFIEKSVVGEGTFIG